MCAPLCIVTDNLRCVDLLVHNVPDLVVELFRLLGEGRILQVDLFLTERVIA